MFKAALPDPGGKDRTLRGAGYRTLSDRTGQDPKTVKRNRNGLIAKSCIRPLGQNTFTEAAQFKVLHFDTILGAWRSQGLFWVRRSGRSVELVTGQTAMPPVGVLASPTVGVSRLTTGGDSDSTPGGTSIPTTGDVSESGIGKAPTPGGGVSPTGGVGISHPSLSTSSNCKTSSQWGLAVRALLEATGYGDDDAVRRMAEAATAHVPDATDQELAHFIREEARRVLRNKTLDNPIGLLIRQVPRRFVGEGFRLYREGIRRQHEAEEAARRENLAEARRILNSAADYSSADIEWAQSVLRDGAGK
jgi:hypothetical protein